MRLQTAKVKTGVWKKRGGIFLVAILFLIVAIVFYRIFLYVSPFVPPEFETNVGQGLPSPDKNMGYDSVAAPSGFSVGLCSTMYQQEDESLVIYLTNPKINDVNIRCEIKTEDGTIIYKSGALKPNEYLEKMSPVTKLSNKPMNIQIYIYGYEQNTWYSKGTIVLENILQPY